VGAFVQFYGCKLLDASLLMMPSSASCLPTIPVCGATVEAIEKHLMTTALARYARRPQWMPATRRGGLLACTFWLAETTCPRPRGGRTRLFERLLDIRNDLGLLGEEYTPRRGASGNFRKRFRRCWSTRLATSAGPAGPENITSALTGLHVLKNPFAWFRLVCYLHALGHRRLGSRVSKASHKSAISSSLAVLAKGHPKAHNSVIQVEFSSSAESPYGRSVAGASVASRPWSKRPPTVMRLAVASITGARSTNMIPGLRLRVIKARTVRWSANSIACSDFGLPMAWLGHRWRSATLALRRWPNTRCAPSLRDCPS